MKTPQNYLITVAMMMTSDDADFVVQSSFVMERDRLPDLTLATVAELLDTQIKMVKGLRPMTTEEIATYRESLRGDD